MTVALEPCPHCGTMLTPSGRDQGPERCRVVPAPAASEEDGLGDPPRGHDRRRTDDRHATVERDQMRLEASRAEADRDEARAQIAAALALHVSRRDYTSGSTDPRHVPSYETRCERCGSLYPCPTVAALSSPVTHPEPEPVCPSCGSTHPSIHNLDGTYLCSDPFHTPVVVPEFVDPERREYESDGPFLPGEADQNR